MLFISVIKVVFGSPILRWHANHLFPTPLSPLQLCSTWLPHIAVHRACLLFPNADTLRWGQTVPFIHVLPNIWDDTWHLEGFQDILWKKCRKEWFYSFVRRKKRYKEILVKIKCYTRKRLKKKKRYGVILVGNRSILLNIYLSLAI